MYESHYSARYVGGTRSTRGVVLEIWYTRVPYIGDSGLTFAERIHTPSLCWGSIMSNDSSVPAKGIKGKRGTGDSGFETLEEENLGPPPKQSRTNLFESDVESEGLLTGADSKLPAVVSTRVEDTQQTVQHEITEGMLNVLCTFAKQESVFLTWKSDVGTTGLIVHPPTPVIVPTDIYLQSTLSVNLYTFQIH